MVKALFVSLNETYHQLSDVGRQPDSAALRNCTTVSWRLGSRADGVRLLFGVFHNRVVSGYRVIHALKDWPVLPAGAVAEGRRIVPVTGGVEHVVRRTAALVPGLVGAVRYRDLVESPTGEFFLEGDASPVDEELD